MSSRRIASIINADLERDNVLDRNNKQVTINHSTICRCLKTYYGKPKKIRKVFFLNSEQMRRRVEYCQMVLDRKINFDQIMFTDECIIDLSSYTNDSIRLDPGTQAELKEGKREVYHYINRPRKKFEKSLMICGGISYYGLSKLIFLEGTMNDFAYGQALLFFKDDIDSLRDRYGVKLIFEQDGAACHRTRANITLLNRLFTKDGWIQNSPNSPDLAYPIEDLWSIIKPRVRRRNPKSIGQLKRYLLEEWGAVPIELVQNLCKGFLNRINLVLELKGGRLEPEHLRRKGNKDITYYWEIPKELPNMRVVYNNKKLYKYKKKEMRILRQEIKKVEKIHVDRMKNVEVDPIKKEVEYSAIIRSILNEEGLQKAMDEKRRIFNELKNMLLYIKNMSLLEYIDHLKEIVQEKINRENVEREKISKEREERRRIQKEKKEQERLEKERLKKEKMEKERLKKERKEKERLEKERLEKERKEKERLEKERKEKERLEKERLEKERKEKEKNKKIEVKKVNGMDLIEISDDEEEEEAKKQKDVIEIDDMEDDEETKNGENEEKKENKENDKKTENKENIENKDNIETHGNDEEENDENENNDESEEKKEEEEDYEYDYADSDENSNADSMLDDIYVEQKINDLLNLKKVDRRIRYKIKF